MESLVLGVFLALPAAQDGPPPPVRPLAGTFIQLHGGNLDADWKAAFAAMTDAGLDTIILQYLKFDDVEFIREKNDPARTLLELADARNRESVPGRRVRVFLGLANVGDWHGGRGADGKAARRREAARAGCLELAGKIRQRYGGYASFAGWYIPMEGDNCYDPDDAGTLDAVGGLYRDIARECRRLLDRPVAMSAFFNTERWCAGADRAERAYARLLAGGHIQILLLQDGVGERGWDGRVRENIDPFFRAFGRACAGAGVELWGVAECFRLQGKDRRVPLADTGLLEAQLRAIQAHGVRTTVAFEFTAYLDPNPRASGGDPGRAGRQALYEGCRRIFTRGGDRP